jgi:6-phosphogluconolactonase/glucosamine-6-phosphate isomerase/deaminase
MTPLHLAYKKMFPALVHLAQVDERVAPPDHSDRNITHLRESSLAPTQVSTLSLLTRLT